MNVAHSLTQTSMALPFTKRKPHTVSKLCMKVGRGMPFFSTMMTYLYL